MKKDARPPEVLTLNKDPLRVIALKAPTPDESR
jgi:hypothetical protein